MNKFLHYFTEAVLHAHRENTRAEALEAVRRVLKSAPDWDGGRTHRKKPLRPIGKHGSNDYHSVRKNIENIHHNNLISTK